MKIELETIKRIAKRTPELTVAELYAVWCEKLDEAKREDDRTRHRKVSETDGNERKQPETVGSKPTRDDSERELYAYGAQVCGKNSSGIVAALMKQNHQDVAAVHSILEVAGKKHDPRGYAAGAIRRAKNGAGNSTMEAFDDLIDRAGGGEVESDPPMRDITPRRA